MGRRDRVKATMKESWMAGKGEGLDGEGEGLDGEGDWLFFSRLNADCDALPVVILINVIVSKMLKNLNPSVTKDLTLLLQWRFWQNVQIFMSSGHVALAAEKRVSWKRATGGEEESGEIKELGIRYKNRKKMRPNRDKSKETKQGQNLHGLYSLNFKICLYLFD